MKVFISWSGAKSQTLAEELRIWLPSVLQRVEPFMSSTDIEAGSRWRDEIAARLDDTNFGLILVTRENRESRWLNFEAGALAKSIDDGRIVPIAVDLKTTDVESPLSQFQAIEPTEKAFRELISQMNDKLTPPLAPKVMDDTFSLWWPKLAEAVTAAQQSPHAEATSEVEPARTSEDMIVEILETVRAMNRQRTAGRPSQPRGPEGSLIDSARRLRELNALLVSDGFQGNAVHFPDAQMVYATPGISDGDYRLLQKLAKQLGHDTAMVNTLPRNADDVPF